MPPPSGCSHASGMPVPGADGVRRQQVRRRRRDSLPRPTGRGTAAATGVAVMSSRLCGGSASAVLPPPVVFAGASGLRPPRCSQRPSGSPDSATTSAQASCPCCPAFQWPTPAPAWCVLPAGGRGECGERGPSRVARGPARQGASRRAPCRHRSSRSHRLAGAPPADAPACPPSPSLAPCLRRWTTRSGRQVPVMAQVRAPALLRPLWLCVRRSGPSRTRCPATQPPATHLHRRRPVRLRR